MRFEPRLMGFEKAASLEWLLANGLGGYASSTIAGLNTRKYHGLLVASTGGLRRYVCLQELRDAVECDGVDTMLYCIESESGLHLPGLDCLSEFRSGPHEAVFVYTTPRFSLSKRVVVACGSNGVSVSYVLSNRCGSPVRHVVRPVVNFRSIHEVRRGVFPFDVRVSGKNAFFSTGGNTVSFSVSHGTLKSSDVWARGLYYRVEALRGYEAVEDSPMPLEFAVEVPAGETLGYRITAGVGMDAKVDAEVRGGKRASVGLMGLLRDAAGSFIVDVEGGRTVVAGYHWFGEWGRDAMIALPGLTLANGRMEDARMVLERFLGMMRGGRVMTETESGSPSYRDYDSTLWMIDRVMQYVKYAGPEAGRKLLRECWDSITEAMEYYAGIEHDGLIKHKGGTWMDTLERANAVEVQALWYNALKAYGRLAGISGLKAGVPVGDLAGRFEERFVDAYWNGRCLRDCAGDDSLRPSQLIALSLDYTCVGREEALSVLEGMEGSLLTPYGLRTLDPGDGRYRGVYAGNVRERDEAYHNGTVWPWLLGPYVKACVRYRGAGERGRLRLLLEDFFARTVAAGAAGSIAEVFDGDPPHKPGGCISQAWSVGETLRAYVEDALGRTPKYGRLFEV